jgi:hypothetical protein
MAALAGLALHLGQPVHDAVQLAGDLAVGEEVDLLVGKSMAAST